ncbi:hypothetical protein [Kitasatospora phosalacinea]|uniref:Uncharacterized protein n=1 Tax=Kitasatospora phosalacinea TaxID=2065 RepID=A0A9W6URY5_9ACTN|nr:hypothetical protein [Kitasatospora phosalacinea]GLW58003.1 hypothetical protein Kpho01_60140 [Kitasatospora phosalacinea]
MKSPRSEASALRAVAELIDDKRAKLPAGGSPFVLPKPVEVGRQVVGLGRVVAELGDEYLFRAAESAPQQYTVLAAEAFASASGSVAQAASALGAVAQQLAFIARTANMHDEPRHKEARTLAYGTAEYAVETARDDLADAARVLRACAETSAPALVGLRQGAYTRSAHATAPKPPPPDRAADERAADLPDRFSPAARVGAALSPSSVQPSTSPAASSDAVAVPVPPVSSAPRRGMP